MWRLKTKCFVGFAKELRSLSWISSKQFSYIGEWSVMLNEEEDFKVTQYLYEKNVWRP